MQETTKTLTRTEITEQYLAHHGIKGQRWGVRRFQNSDGSLTAAGKKRRGVSDKDNENSEKKESRFKNYMSRTPAGIMGNAIKNGQNPLKELHEAKKEVREQAKENLKAKKEAKKEAKELKKAEKEAKKTGIPIDETPEQREARKQAALQSGRAKDVMAFQGQLTNQELQSAYQRINTERLLTSISQSEKKTTWDHIADIGKTVTTVTTAAESIQKLYNFAATINNSLNSKFNLPVLDGGKTRSENFIRKSNAAEIAMNFDKLSTSELREFVRRQTVMDEIRSQAIGVGEVLDKE